MIPFHLKFKLNLFRVMIHHSNDLKKVVACFISEFLIIEILVSLKEVIFSTSYDIP